MEIRYEKSELLKVAKPILFNTPMVKTILEGRKTVTRRIVKPKLKKDESGFRICINEVTGEKWVEKIDENESSIFPDGSIRYVNPPYRPGDILYVRETWCIDSYSGVDLKPHYYYKAGAYNPDRKWRPSIHMPKEAARIFLKVTDVGIERLQDIDGYEVEKEGLKFINNPLVYEDKQTFNSLANKEFSKLWNSTIKKDQLSQYGWEANPWVWVIEFVKLEVIR